MELSEKMVCTELLLDLISYEKLRGRLSPEMAYLFDRHLEQCTECREKITDFHRTLHGAEIMRNFG